MLFNFFVKLDIHPFGLIALKKTPKCRLIVLYLICYVIRFDINSAGLDVFSGSE